MPSFHAFAGLRYSSAVVPTLTDVVCPPYDVISPAEQALLQHQSPYNAVRVELPADEAEAPGSRYAAAARLLVDWRDRGVLTADPRPAYYLHLTRLPLTGRVLERQDVFGALRLEPWSTGAVRPHEHTFPGAKADRMALLRATRCNLSPIWLMYRDEPEALARAWSDARSRPPDASFALGEEEHSIWVLDEPESVAAIQQQLQDGGPFYIADGHHRYETALAFKSEMADTVPGADSALALITHVSDPGLLVLPTHRVLTQLANGWSWDAAAREWETLFTIRSIPLSGDPRAAADSLLRAMVESGRLAPTIGVARSDTPDQGLLLTLRDRAAADARLRETHSAAWAALDVSLLHATLLEPLLEDVRGPRDEVLRFTRDAAEALTGTRDGSGRLAFFLNPTAPEQVLDVADARDRMPEKSTYFFPKPPTGLVIRDLMQT